MLWAAADIRFDETAAVAAQKLRGLVSGVLGRSEPERVSAALAIASGIALPDNPLERLSPGIGRR